MHLWLRHCPEDLVLDGCINLASLWKFFSKQRDSIRSEASCLECIFILIGGLALFPNEALTISAYHAELMCMSVCNLEKSLSQSVLAFTIRGLSSACLGGPFFGSPFLVLRWLDEHILLPALDTGLPLEEYVRKFCACEVKPQIDFFNHLSTF